MIAVIALAACRLPQFIPLIYQVTLMSFGACLALQQSTGHARVRRTGIQQQV